ncbi:putative RNA polymerase II subunit B1 CTD phosphatase RPAP2 isoform X2 [Lingula anatina]|uniref:RNA polymerase II subunit B1 CTD phosphatase RPAP2 homolog n=1 Tax=Lingula anatina TaxID=7574 RepID=A0A1S3JM88_LINAN|nr:putative RNA polymerase II subunit B1 CTD phosphatase RPAP2 isoform X2 [Lingula anatina]|eukprot:XP_013411525.1 putative RNA polymerase II subunit B1 CTD phosphatase RPAP2 isoform X2 [Lingula anatina]
MSSNVGKRDGTANERREMLLRRLQKQKEAQQKALNILQQTLDGAVTQDFVFENAHYIDPPVYQDIVEERHLAKLCGYLLCGQELGQIPKQKYHISAKNNRVYDISERKKFCSNRCYKASSYLQQQLLTSPLYLRDQETPVTIQLLPDNCHIGNAAETIITKEQSQIALELRNTELEDQRKRGMTVKTRRTTKNVEIATEDGKEETQNQFTSVADMSPSTEEQISSHVMSREIKEKEHVLLQTSPKHVHTEKVMVSSRSTDIADTNSGIEQALGSSEDKLDELLVQDTAKMNISVGHEDKSTDKVTKYGVERNEHHDAQNAGGQSRKNVFGLIHTSPKHSNTDLDSDDDEDGDDGGIEMSGSHGNHDDAQQDKVTYLMELLAKREKMLQKSSSLKNQDNSSSTQSSGPENGAFNKDPKTNEKDCDTLKTVDACSKETDLKVHVSKGHPQISSRKSELQTVRKESCIDLLSQIEKAILEWTTESTIEYLTGDKASKQKIIKKQEFDEKYAEMGRRVHLKQLDLDSAGLYEAGNMEGERQGGGKLPDMKTLQKDGQEFGLKVTEFYKGSTAYSVEVQDESGAVEKKGSGDEKSEEEPILPMVDHYSQQQIRKKIVLERLSKILPDLLVPLNLPLQEVSAELRLLVGTFSLGSHNILFRSVEWNIVAIVLLKMLGMHKQSVGIALEQPSAAWFLKQVLAPFA